MRVGIYAESLNHFIEMHAYFLADNNNVKVIVITSIKENSDTHSEHPWSLKRMQEFKKIEIVSLDASTCGLDWLYIYTANNHFLWNRHLNRWFLRAKRIGILSASCSSIVERRNIIRELVYAFPYYLFAQSIELVATHPLKTIFFFIKNKFTATFSVHPQFLVNEYWKKKIFMPIEAAEQPRVFKFVFMGNRNPPQREAVLRKVEQKIRSIKDMTIINEFVAGNTYKDRNIVLWIEYGDTDSKRGLPPEIYAEALGMSDFCICPFGCVGLWMHRVIESLLRQAIPVLEDEKIYNLGLKDMENCIVVRKDNWAEAIERAYALSPDEVCRIRLNIAELRDKFLLSQIAALRLSKAMLPE